MFDKLKQILGVDIQNLLMRSTSFLSNHFKDFEEFYSGTSSIEVSVVQESELLHREIKDSLLLVGQFKHQLLGTNYLEVLEVLEDLESKFTVLKKLPKWLRCTYYKEGSWSNQVSVEVQIGPNQSLESVLRELKGSDETWWETSLHNLLSEKDYSQKGGGVVKILSDVRRNTTSLTSVIDVINSTTVYGKDFTKDLEFVNEDLDTVTGEDCLLQSLNILVGLRKNDNPTFPELGIQKELILGINRNTLNLPITQRQVRETVLSDDTFVDFKIIKTNFEEDKLFIEFEAEGIDGQQFTQQQLV